MTIRLYSGWRDNDLEYTFPSVGEMAPGWGGGMEAETEDMRFRSRLQDKRHSPGGFNTGDNLLESRKINIAGVLEGPSRADVMLAVNELKNACYRGNHNWENTLLQITQYSSAPFNQVYRVSGLSRCIVDWISHTAVEVAVTFNLADPFRHNRAETRIPVVGGADVELVMTDANNRTAEWTINVPGDAAYIQMPRILAIKYAGSMDSLVITNLSARRPSGARTGLRLGALQRDSIDNEPHHDRALLIDSERSSVHLCKADNDGSNIRDRVNWVHKMTDGDFPWLQPGENILRFRAWPMSSGDETHLRVYLWYRRRYL